MIRLPILALFAITSICHTLCSQAAQEDPNYSTANWNEKSDQAIVKARLEIEKTYSKSTIDYKKEWETINAMAHGKVKTPVIAYRWALTGYYSSLHGISVPKQEIGDALVNAPQDDFEFARVRFLLWPNLNGPQALALGKRLRARDPSDDEVAFVCLRYTAFTDFRVPENLQYATNLGAKLEAKHPNSPRTLRALGYVYFQGYSALKKRDYAVKSLAYWKRYLAMVPAAKKKDAWFWKEAFKELEAGLK
jgi:hypothetical protein